MSLFKLSTILGGMHTELPSALENSDKLNAKSNIPLAKGIKPPKIIKLASIKIPKPIGAIASHEAREIATNKYLELAGRGFPDSKSIPIALRHVKNLGHDTKQMKSVLKIVEPKKQWIQGKLFEDKDLK